MQAQRRRNGQSNERGLCFFPDGSSGVAICGARLERVNGLATGKPVEVVEDRPGRDPGVGGATSLTSGDACVTCMYQVKQYHEIRFDTIAIPESPAR